ncbi:cytochrome-c peroxidase [Flavobacterium sp. RNTU_13]|uniref:cytochrome-c peroxidase n=1 Tax=Flavobacterium sp. RNTU_13 TaxID=3375145 RepID=UPI0039858EDB
MKLLYTIAALLPLLVSCGGSTDSDYENLELVVKKPSNFPAMTYDFTNNPVTQKGFELGRKLFYDGRLSSDGLVSCAFCHIQENAFTHHGHTVSHGVDNRVGTRNAPAVQNMAFLSSYMWDGVTTHLDLQPLIPLTSDVEMHGDLNAILAMMKADAQYQRLFAQAYPQSGVSVENMLKSLSQFMIMMVSDDSRFDKYRRGEAGGTLTAEELQGYALFNQKCATCHATDLQTDGSFRNNGLPVNPQVNDVGRYKITELAADYYKFRVPSLRNVALTAPYMHDGRFGTLQSVLNYYATGVSDSPTLDPLLRHADGTRGIALTEDEKTAIIAFLNTLTDETFITDKSFSEFQ